MFRFSLLSTPSSNGADTAGAVRTSNGDFRGAFTGRALRASTFLGWCRAR
jgi:hypothetical protein